MRKCETNPHYNNALTILVMCCLYRREHGAGFAHTHVVLSVHTEVVVAPDREVRHRVVCLCAVNGANVHPVVALSVSSLDDVRLDSRTAVRRWRLPSDRDRLDAHFSRFQVGWSSGNI